MNKGHLKPYLKKKFDQHLSAAHSKCWSKYTTIGNWFNDNQDKSVLVKDVMVKKDVQDKAIVPESKYYLSILVNNLKGRRHI